VKKCSPAIFLACTLAVGVALAASPHFVSATSALSGNTVAVSFKEAGLGANARIDYLASADVSATWACINKGGANPAASNKRSVESPVSQGSSLSSDKNGTVSGTITLPAVTQPSDFTCPPGQKTVLVEVTFANIKIEDKTNGVSQAAGGPFSKTVTPVTWR
jgi:hypothetical protein